MTWAYFSVSAICNWDFLFSESMLARGLFIFSGYALAQKTEKSKMAILVPMLAFVVWYWAFNRNYDPVFLAYFIGTIVLISVLFGALTKGVSFKPEFYGFLPVLFLFLDIGLDHSNQSIVYIIQQMILLRITKSF